MPLTMSEVPLAAMVKDLTKTEHEEVEQLLLPYLASVQSTGDYAVILKMFYGYFLPLEKKIEAFITPAILPDIAERRKASAILHDLSAIGQEVDSLSLSPHLPKIENAAQAMGALYVLEGSTLGGKMIAKMLRNNEALSLTDDKLSFFSGYGEETGSKWKTFLHVLNQQESRSDVVKGANETFFYLKSWMQQSFSHDQGPEL
jgi:heme oxygenase (biliverdin-IX-beta and delta-forming)